MTASSSLSDSSYFVGIDVAKTKLDLGRTDSDQVVTYANDPDGIRKLVASLRSPPPQRIVVESTGGLERPVLDALLDAGLPVAMVNPRNVRNFADGIGILAKSDAIDAGVLKQYARLANPRLAQKRSENQVELDALVTCRRQLTQLRAAQMNQRGTTTSKAVRQSIDAVIKTMRKEIERLDKKIRVLVETDDDFDSNDKLLQSVPGVGAVVSATLLAEMNELGGVKHRQASALAGVAPYDRDSGARKGRRSIHGGRGTVRTILYMATITAMKCNPVIQAFAQRLARAGKPKKVQIVACMRKLLGYLNVMLRDRIPWQQLTVVKALDI